MKKVATILVPFTAPEAVMTLLIGLFIASIGGWKRAVLSLVGAYVLVVIMAAFGVKPLYRFVRNK